MSARATKQTSTPAREQGYKVLDDQDLVQLTEARIRQIEGELAGHKGLLEEMAADPHQAEDPDDPANAVTATRKLVESFETRLNDVLYPRLDAARKHAQAAKDAAAKAAADKKGDAEAASS